MASLFPVLVLEIGLVRGDGKGRAVEAEKGHGASRAQTGSTVNLGRVSHLAECWDHLGVLTNTPQCPRLCPTSLGGLALAENL